jgi:hypothetical protein
MEWTSEEESLLKNGQRDFDDHPDWEVLHHRNEMRRREDEERRGRTEGEP